MANSSSTAAPGASRCTAKTPRPDPTGSTTREGRMARRPVFASVSAPTARSPTTTRVRFRSRVTSYAVRPIRRSAHSTRITVSTTAATVSSHQPRLSPPAHSTAAATISTHAAGRMTPAPARMPRAVAVPTRAAASVQRDGRSAEAADPSVEAVIRRRPPGPAVRRRTRGPGRRRSRRTCRRTPPRGRVRDGASTPGGRAP